MVRYKKWDFPRVRMFGGKQYRFAAARYSKVDARRLADSMREGGLWNARFIRVNNPYDLRPEYHVFKRRRK